VEEPDVGSDFPEVKVVAFEQGQGHLLLTFLAPGEDELVAEGARRWNWVWASAGCGR
jgi:hypothetical protein